MQAQAQDVYFVLCLCWGSASHHGGSTHPRSARRADAVCCLGAVCLAVGVVCPAAAAARLLCLC